MMNGYRSKMTSLSDSPVAVKSLVLRKPESKIEPPTHRPSEASSQRRPPSLRSRA